MKLPQDLIFIFCLMFFSGVAGWWISYDYYTDIHEQVEHESKLMQYCSDMRQKECLYEHAPCFLNEDYFECMDPVGPDCSVKGKQEEFREEFIEHRKQIKEIVDRMEE